MIRVLPPGLKYPQAPGQGSQNLSPRQRTLLHALLQLKTVADLQSHPNLGASWEGFALEQVIGTLGSRDVYFWATHGGAELDLLVRSAGKHYGFEFKYADAPGSSRSTHVAIDDLDSNIFGWFILATRDTPSTIDLLSFPSMPCRFSTWRNDCDTWRFSIHRRERAPVSYCLRHHVCFHLITLSARASTLGGIVLAVTTSRAAGRVPSQPI